MLVCNTLFAPLPQHCSSKAITGAGHGLHGLHGAIFTIREKEFSRVQSDLSSIQKTIKMTGRTVDEAEAFLHARKAGVERRAWHS